MKTKELIEDVEKEIEETKEKLLSILRPLYDKSLSEVIEILGEDMLFYGDCCKREGKLEGIKLGEKAKEEEIYEKMEDIEYNPTGNWNPEDLIDGLVISLKDWNKLKKDLEKNE